MMPGRKSSTGGYNFGQGVGPLVLLDPHMGRNPTEIDTTATASHENNLLQNGQHQGMRRVKLTQGLEGTTMVTEKGKRLLRESKNDFEGI